MSEFKGLLVSGRHQKAIKLMKQKNSGKITTSQMLEQLEETLGKEGMDMLALWGIMIANGLAPSRWEV